jgi:tetratricopeptide (TPR) repeat protein
MFKNCTKNNRYPGGILLPGKGMGETVINHRHLTSMAAVCLIFLLSLIGHSDAALANYNKRGLRAYTIEGVLRLDNDEIDLATAALILSRDWGTTKTSHVYRRKIDDMAEEIIERVKDAHVPMNHRAVPVINKYLYDELAFATIDNADDPDDLFLHIIIERKQGYCLSLSVLYLSLAERLGLPIHGVVVPGHFFVRYDDGQTRFNIETTSFGNTATDEHYKKKFKAPKHLKSLYMKNLTKKQTLGCFFNNLGNCYLQIGNTQRAFEILSMAVQINPLLSEAHMNLGNIYIQRRQPHEAIRKYEQALSILGREANAFNGLGIAHMQIGDYRKAESYFNTALSLEPESIESHRNLAHMQHLQGKNNAALTALKNVLTLAPNDLETLVLIGKIYQNLKENNNAAYYLEKAIAQAPHDASARCSLGYLYLESGRTAAALAEFSYVIDYIGDDANAFFGLGRVYQDRGEPDNAVWAYKKALDISPHMVPALQNLGNAYLDTQMLAEAIEVYWQAVEIEPNNGPLHYNLAVSLAKNKQHQEAVNQFLIAVDLGSMQAAAYNGIAISYYRLREFENAKIYAHKAKALGYNVQKALLDL